VWGGTPPSLGLFLSARDGGARPQIVISLRRALFSGGIFFCAGALFFPRTGNFLGTPLSGEKNSSQGGAPSMGGGLFQRGVFPRPFFRGALSLATLLCAPCSPPVKFVGGKLGAFFRGGFCARVRISQIRTFRKGSPMWEAFSTLLGPHFPRLKEFFSSYLGKNFSSKNPGKKRKLDFLGGPS